MTRSIICRRARFFAAALSIAIMAGCGAMKPLPSDTFYRLDIEPNGTPMTTAQQWTDKLIRVSKFRASGVHRERPIVYSHADEPTVQQHRYHLWIDSPERMLQQELVDYLRAANVAAHISASDLDGGGLEVKGEIRQMDQVMDGTEVKVQVVINFELIAMESERSLILGREYRQILAVAGSDMGATALAMSEAVAATFELFVTDASNALSN